MLPHVMGNTSNIVVNAIPLRDILGGIFVHHSVHHHTFASIAQCLQINVLTHDVMRKMVLVERYVSLHKHQPITVIEAISRISLT